MGAGLLDHTRTSIILMFLASKVLHPLKLMKKGYINAKKEDFINPEDFKKYKKNLKRWRLHPETRKKWNVQN